jgi:hypothetical protein
MENKGGFAQATEMRAHNQTQFQRKPFTILFLKNLSTLLSVP